MTAQPQQVEILAVTGEAATSDEAIRLCGAALQERGYVGAAFAQDCIDREQTHPTGLVTAVPVAIPHARSEAISVDSVCYLRLENPVSFGRMDDEEQSVMTRSILNLAIKSGSDHVDFLARTIKVLIDADLVTQLEAIDIADVPEFFRQCLKTKGKKK